METQARGGGPAMVGASSARTAEEQTERAAGGLPGRPAPPQLRCRLGRADLKAVPEARRALRALLRHWGGPGTSDVAELLTSELVTNALVHTDADAVLTATVSTHGLRVEVRDFVARRPRPRAQGTGESTGGRGLVLVQSLADTWGVCMHGVGKSVWFELGAQAA
ncbi:ATP-binding protein [Streptomyces sp. NPDC088337]|uniref:ATP-binding protein n=1 Tax=unclassified Streptomyces TaxID=2593676 RepID=UPI000C27A93F|nr:MULTISPECIES: ATP-binding protein [unclassified Streptomyces]PJM97459.1 hypothetical protein CG719_00665 [Streptomyces sp. CB01373]WSB29487.1 ATP-binding protein [Streptomyces sp. NBC_01788]